MKLEYVYKCRGCGTEINVEPTEMPHRIKWMLEDIFDENYTSAAVRTDSQIDAGKYILHRCNPETLCICDMIGWRKEEE